MVRDDIWIKQKKKETTKTATEQQKQKQNIHSYRHEDDFVVLDNHVRADPGLVEAATLLVLQIALLAHAWREITRTGGNDGRKGHDPLRGLLCT